MVVSSGTTKDPCSSTIEVLIVSIGIVEVLETPSGTMEDSCSSTTWRP